MVTATFLNEKFFVFKTQENLGHWSVFPMTIFLFMPFSPRLTQNHFITSILKQIIIATLRNFKR